MGANVVPLKRLASIMPSNVDKHSVEGEQSVRLCNYVDVYKNERITEAMDFMEATATDAQIDRFTLKANDVIVTKDSEEPTDIGIPAYVPSDLPGVVCGYHLAVLRPDQGRLHGGYLHWALQSAEVQAYYATAATGISRYALGIQELGMTPVHVPSVPEQQRIANFLDEQTARIDSLIAEKEKLDGLLAEYRQSLISEAVTGRLDPETGRSWAEEGGAGVKWSTTRLRYVADLNPAVRSDLLSAQDTEVSFLPMEAIGEDGSLNLERVRPVAEVRNGYSYFENGDVAFAKVTPCFENGKGSLMRNLQFGAGFGTSELTVLRPKGDTSAKFLNYVVQSSQFRQHGAGAMTGAGGLKRVPDDFTRDFKTPWPGQAEQERIANFLDEQTARIDALRQHVKKHITLLREYRSSLISAAVTGQLDISTYKSH